MIDVYFVTYPTTKPWGSNFFYENLAKHSENNVIEITPKQSTKMKDTLLFYHNIQNIPKTFFGKPLINYLKRSGNTVIAGLRGHIGFDKWKEAIHDLDHVVCNIDAELVEKVHDETDNYTVFYPGVDSEIFKPMSLVKSVDLSWVGRDHKGFKNSDILPKLGYSYAKATYKNYIPHHELPEFINQSKIHIVTSDHEGFCRPALEAALCGIPVVGPRIGIIPEIIPDGCIIDGSPKKSISQYKAIINHLLSNSIITKFISDQSRENALRFTWEHSAKIFDQIIKEQTN